MSSILKGLRLNELSNTKLGKYKTSASADATAADKTGDTKKADKRFSGIVKATKKEFANDEKKKVAEGSEFGATYAEQLAQKVFNVKPKLASEDDVLNIGHKVATQDLMSQVRANYLFARDQDFPSDFVSAYYYLQKGNLNEFAPVGGDDREPDEEEILRQLAAKWWLGTEQEMSKAQKTLAAMGWDIGQDESGDDDAGVFVIRVGDENGDSYIAFNHSDLEELNEAYNKYHANRTGFSRGQRDDERHDLDTPTQVWGLKINGKVWSKGGKDVSFTSKEAALNTRNAILKNKPDLEIGLVTKGGVAEEKQRLDPHCWDNKKIGNPKTKMKGGVRVNNCVPKESKSHILAGLQQLDEGWKEKLGAAALTGAMALGAGAAHGRVTYDADGNQVGGMKPTATVQAEPAPATPSTATIPGQGLVRAERADRQAGTVTVDGQEYKMIMLEPGGIRPRGGQQIVIPQAVMGERGIGNYMAILAGGRVFVLPRNE